MRRAGLERLRERLDALYRTYDASYLCTDPLWFPRQYAAAADREVVGLIASLFAYGNVRQIFRSLGFIFERLGATPAAELRGGGAKALRVDAFRHRLHGPADLRLLLSAISRVLREWGSIGAMFEAGDDGDLRSSLGRFSRSFLAEARRCRLSGGEYFQFFFPDPVFGKSACKRMNLFLRWMARSDSLDLGLWKHLDPSRLVIPLDTHVARISRYVGLTSRRTPDWKMAEEITETLRGFDPGDPVKYDFSISRLGILRLCPTHRDPECCAECALVDVCRL